MNQSESIGNSVQDDLDNSIMQEYSVQSIQFRHSDLASVHDILSIIEQHISECPCKISLLLYNTIFCTENKKSTLSICVPEPSKIHSKAFSGAYLFRIYIGNKKPHTRRESCTKAIPFSAIICFESLKRELILHTVNATMQHEKFSVSGSIAAFQRMPEFKKFIRINRNTLVNPDNKTLYREIFRQNGM